MESPMSISVSQMEGRVPVTVLHVSGAVDASTAKDLEAKAMEACDGGAKDLLLDLSDVNYMASAGFRAMHVIYNRLHGGESHPKEGAAHHLKVLNPSEEVRRIFKTLGFDNYLEIHEDLREAVNSF